MAADFENRIDDSIAINNDIGDSIIIDLSSIAAVKVPIPTILQDKEIVPSTKTQVVSADKGFDGLGTITVSQVTSDIDENITARNIRGGVTILGVTGDLEPDKPDQSKVVEPSTSEQVVRADSGYELASVTIKAVTAEIDGDIVAENIRKDTEILGVVGTMEAREDIDAELAEQETLIAELESGVNELPEKPVDKLQWKCDNIKSLAYEFYGVFDMTPKIQDETVVNIMQGIDTSNVIYMNYAFADSSGVQDRHKDLSEITINASNCKTMTYLLFNQIALTKIPKIINAQKLEDISYLFGNCKSIESLDLSSWRTSLLKTASYFVYECLKLRTLNLTNWDTSNVTSFYMSFYNCKELVEIIGVIDLISATSLNNIIGNCTKLETITFKNIKRSLQIGSGTSYGYLLTLDSLLNTIQELWNNTDNALNGTRTLTMSTASKTLLQSVYVRLVGVTDEMRAEDEYIDNKVPFEVCESTDDGAMTIIEYATTVKNWQIA